VAPIALYPDELLSQVLVASTYPLEVVQAYQWLQQHPELKGHDLTDAAAKQSWDPSVQALVAFPDLLKRMSQDVTWITNLGNAFLANQTLVMDTVQKLRINAEKAGKLASSDKEKVVNKTENGQEVVEVEPANPEVIYVPVYDPVWIWGPAPVWYPYPYWYYPPLPLGYWCVWGPPILFGAFFFGIGWAGWGWGCGWYHHTVIVNNVFFNRNNFVFRGGAVVGGRAVWQHDPAHRLGVAYPNRVLAQHYSPASVHWAPGGARPGMAGASYAARPRLSAAQVQGQLRESGARVRAAAPAMERMGNRQISSGGYTRGGSAFGGIGQGRQARTYSNRGYSSLSSARAGGWGGRGGGGGSRGGGFFGGGHGGGSFGGGGRR
jgi:hypothetical protein